jgi:hypothetical protein
MRPFLFVALLPLAACGGKSTPAPAPANEATTEAPPPDTGGDTYGGWGYGGWGYGGYGGDMYGAQGWQEPEPYVPPPPVPPSLVGTWRSACAATGKEWSRVEQVYTDTRFDVRVGTFSDKDCAKRTSEVHSAGTYAFGEQSTALPASANVWNVTFTADLREITADDKKSAKALGKACGVKLKAKGTADVLAKGCPKLAIKPAAECATEYDIAGLDGDKLRLGTGDACAAEQRPTALDTTVDVAYQWQPIGNAECDALIAALPRVLACAMVPAEAKTGTFEAYRQMEVGLRQGLTASDPAVVQATTDACKQGNDALAQGLASMGC